MKSRLWRKLLIPLLAVALAGCSGSDGGSDVIIAGGDSGGGNNPPPPPDPQTLVFDYPNFPVGGQLTLVSPFQPPGETSAVTAEVFAAVQEGPFSSLARMTLGKAVAVADSEPAILQAPCGTSDVASLTTLMGEGSGGRNGADILSQAVPTIRPRFQELPEGAEEKFFLITAFKSVQAKKVLEPSETVHCTIFAELDGQGNPCITRQKALQVATAFDSNNPNRPGSGIYDQVRNAFGSEWNQNPLGGNDGDTKVVLFFFRSATLGSGLFGYTSPIDQSPTPSELSNKAEIVYVNADKDLIQTLSTLAHEFQHLINQNEKIVRQGTFPAGAQDENVSVNEGLSQLAEEICGFDFDNGNTLLVDVCNDYLSRPDEHQFFDFFAAGLGYGQGYLYFKYVREHFGDATIRAIATSPEVGKANLDAQLPPGFDETFRRWTVANYATNLGGAVPSIYRYPSGFQTNGNYDAGQLVGVQSFLLSSEGFANLGAWSVAYQTFPGGSGDDVRLIVDTAPGSPVGVVVEAARGTFTAFDE